MIHVCPTDVVAAPAERIWGLLTEPEALPAWSGTTLAAGPGRSMAAGVRIGLRKGPFRIVWDMIATTRAAGGVEAHPQPAMYSRGSWRAVEPASRPASGGAALSASTAPTQSASPLGMVANAWQVPASRTTRSSTRM